MFSVPRLSTAALAALVTATTALAQDPARMEQVVQSHVAKKQFMGTVLVARGGDVILSKGYGSANLEWDVPAAPSTRFRIGSVTKQFTAAAVLLLEERGRISLRDPIRQHLSDAPAAWDRVTVYHLLTHTSGIPNFTSLPEYQSLQVLPTTTEKLVAAFRDKPLEFEPGENWNYSNSRYVLLGHLIEKISGESYEQFLQKNIFTPLGMKDSGYDSNSAIIPRRAVGYTPGAGGPSNAPFIHMTVPHAAGALYSTTEDLLRWEQGLFGGKVLSASSLQIMTTPFRRDYGMGVGIVTANGRKRIAHNGGINGFNSFLAYYPESRITVAVLANLNTPAVDDIGGKLGALAHGDAVQLQTERKETTVSPAILAEYVGTYEMAPGVNLWIRLQDRQLTGQLTGQGPLPIFPESDTRFFLRAVDAQVEFGRDEKGAVSHLVLFQAGREVKGTRTGAAVPPLVQRTPVPVAPAILANYAGTYQLQPGFDLRITVEGDHLMAQATGQAMFPLAAESPTKFFFEAAGITIEFVQDEKGLLSHMQFEQGGRPAVKALRR